MHLSLPQRVLDCALSSLLPHAACDKGGHDRLGLCGCRRRPSLVYISLTAHSIKQGISENVAYFILELLTIPVLSTGLTDHPPRGRLESHLQCLLSGSWYDKFSEFRQIPPWSFSSVILTTKNSALWCICHQRRAAPQLLPVWKYKFPWCTWNLNYVARFSSQIFACSWKLLLQSFVGEKEEEKGQREERKELGVGYTKGREHEFCFLSCLVFKMEPDSVFIN